MNLFESSTAPFEDFPINIKLKISALWAAIMFCYLYGDYIEIYVPGVIAQAMEVSKSNAIQLEYFAVALLMSIPSVMVFLTLVLKPKLNRWLNILIPALYIALLIAVNTETNWWFYLYLTVLEIIISLVTIWYAWNWPRKLS